MVKKAIVQNCRRYRAGLWSRVGGPNALPVQWEVTEVMFSASRKKLIRLAKKRLGKLLVTRYNYHRDRGRCNYVSITDSVRGKKTGYVLPETHIVPSLGELGYW